MANPKNPDPLASLDPPKRTREEQMLLVDVMWRMEPCYTRASSLRWEAAMCRLRGDREGAESYELAASEVSLVLSKLEAALERAEVLLRPEDAERDEGQG